MQQSSLKRILSSPSLWIFLLICVVLFSEPILRERPEEPILWLRRTGRVAALIGATLFSLTFLLSLRIRLIDSVFKGFPLAARWHHQLGQLAVFLLFMHPILLAGPQLVESWKSARASIALKLTVILNLTKLAC
jgi:predicted ferric reductase